MRTGPQSLSQQQKGPTPAQMKLMGDMNRIGVYPELEFEIQRGEGKAILPRLSQRGAPSLVSYESSWSKSGLERPQNFPLHLDLFLKQKHIDFEIDGASHRHRQAKDEERDAYLVSIGIKPVHIPNRMVMEYGDVVAAIVGAIL